MSQSDRARNRLQFLLRQAEIFQHFVPETLKQEKQSKKWVLTLAVLLLLWMAHTQEHLVVCMVASASSVLLEMSNSACCLC